MVIAEKVIKINKYTCRYTEDNRDKNRRPFK